MGALQGLGDLEHDCPGRISVAAYPAHHLKYLRVRRYAIGVAVAENPRPLLDQMRNVIGRGTPNACQCCK